MSTDTQALTSLATRLEQAGPESQAELLWELWELTDWSNDYANFINCGAYESAAMMFVPSHLRICAISQSPDATEWYVKLAFISRRGGLPASGASTPALALAAASVRAIAGSSNNGA